MKGQLVAQRNIDRRAALIKIIGRRPGGEGIEMHRLIGDLQGNAFRNDVDRAADGLTAVKQHRRPAQHFDPVGGQRIDTDRMIGGGIGHVERPKPVREDPDTLALKAAQDGPGRAGGKAGR